MQHEYLNTFVNVYLVCNTKYNFIDIQKLDCKDFKLSDFTELSYASFCLTQDDARQKAVHLGFDKYFYVSVSVYHLIMIANAAFARSIYKNIDIKILECYTRTNEFEKVSL